MSLQAGRTVLNTIGAFLVVSLASPIYDLARLRSAQRSEAGPGLQWNRRCASDLSPASDQLSHERQIHAHATSVQKLPASIHPQLSVLTAGLVCSEAEANAYLAMVMILSALLLMVLIRRLGLAIVEIEQSRVSHGAVLKQVRVN